MYFFVFCCKFFYFLDDDFVVFVDCVCVLCLVSVVLFEKVFIGYVVLVGELFGYSIYFGNDLSFD